MKFTRNLSPVFLISLIAICACSRDPNVIASEHGISVCAPVHGDYELIAMRRASDVIGGPVDASAAAYHLGDIVQFGDAMVWLGGERCTAWRLAKLKSPATNLDDPLLKDVVIAPDGGLLAANEGGGIRHYELQCNGAPIGALTRIDERVLVAPSTSGLTYFLFEKPLPAADAAAVQRTLKTRGFYNGEINSEMDDATTNAVSRYATSRGGYDVVYARSAMTHNLLASLDVKTDEACAEPVSETIESRFPDYQPKLSADTVLDYRPSLAPQLAELPEVSRENFQIAYVTLGDLIRDAIAHPGRWEDGNVALGADPQEYVPSDAELLAAELGDRLGALVVTMKPEEIMDAWDGAAVVPPSVSYNRFDYRHADVMGSGRFFYASPPIEVMIDIPPRPGAPG